ncbi:phosphotyrosine protein phosphatase I superfamily [Tribonema minus]|uniref:acid phosphatase n=1 Tax=Tribonema minus TaxID=303371 RepID=A0A835Z874_9STRA|nr:phosphotyrosine protein phosphatase I superfamily [Tribonema minus]
MLLSQLPRSVARLPVGLAVAQQLQRQQWRNFASGRNDARSIMFVCRRNSCRSQMAEGWAKAIVRDKQFSDIIIKSSGLEGSHVHPKAISTMAAHGIELRTHTSDFLDSFEPDDFYAVVSMCGCGHILSPQWAGRPVFMDWDVEDPDGKSDAVFERVSLEIRDQVDKLIDRQHHQQRGSSGGSALRRQLRAAAAIRLCAAAARLAPP